MDVRLTVDWEALVLNGLLRQRKGIAYEMALLPISVVWKIFHFLLWTNGREANSRLTGPGRQWAPAPEEEYCV